MPRNNKLGPGIDQRGQAFRLRLRRRDRDGMVIQVSETFPFDASAPAGSPASRSAVLDKVRAIYARERASLRVEARPSMEAEASMTLRDLLQRYEQEKTPGKKSARSERIAFGRILRDFPQIADAPVSRLRKYHLIDDLNSVEQKMLRGEVERRLEPGEDPPAPIKATTTSRYLSSINRAFKTAISEWGYKFQNPLADFKRFQDNKSYGTLVSNRIWREIMSSAGDTEPGTLAAIVFLRVSGARRSEACKLEWEHLDFATNPPTARLVDTKSHKGKKKYVERRIPLMPTGVESVLWEYKRADLAPKKGRVFGTYHNVAGRQEFRPLKADSITQAWDRARKRAGFPHVRLHDLRHTRITEFAQSNLSLQEVQALSGHADPKMVMRYFHADPVAIGKKLEQVALDVPTPAYEKVLRAPLASAKVKPKASKAVARKARKASL